MGVEAFGEGKPCRVESLHAKHVTFCYNAKRRIVPLVRYDEMKPILVA